MTIAEVSFYEVDGQLGAVDGSAVAIAIAGQAATGKTSPIYATRITDVIAEYGCGDLVEAAAVAIKDWGLPVVVCRINTADLGEVTLDAAGWKGTSAATSNSSNAPIETGDYQIKVETGGTRGTDGIEYYVSYDGGKNWGAKLSLGTATSISLAAGTVGTVVIDLAAGTVLKGDLLKIHTTAPVPTAAEVTAAVDQLGTHVQDWDCLEVSVPVDQTIASAIDASLSSMSSKYKERYWQGNARLPTVSETVTAYKTAITSAFASYSTLRGHIWPADCWFVSRLDGRKMRRPRVWATAPYVERLPLQVDPAQADNGALPGVSLIDEDGNPQLHDEEIHGGFDALRLCSLYTNGLDGVYVGNCHTKSPEGSDYRYVQTRRVINRGKRRLAAYLRKVLSKDVLVSKKTGKMTPSYVRLLKASAEGYIRTAYAIGPMVSDFTVTPDANANVLATETVPFEFEVVPLGYIKGIPVKVIMKNPALSAG